MNIMQHQVQDFHDKANLKSSNELRAKLIMEEAVETVAALGFRATGIIEKNIADGGTWWEQAEDVALFVKHYDEYNHLDYIDGLCDLLYVTIGGAVDLNINIQPHFNEVHRANMAKLKGPKREDGKQLKPEGWQPPDHQRIMEEYPSDTLEGQLGVPQWNLVHAHDDPPVSHTPTPEALPTVSLWDAATTVISRSPQPDRG